MCISVHIVAVSDEGVAENGGFGGGVCRWRRGAEGQNYFPRFSRQHCGGSNRNGVLFKQYSNVSACRLLRQTNHLLRQTKERRGLGRGSGGLLGSDHLLARRRVWRAQSDELLASARTGYVNKPTTPRDAVSLQEMGVPSMEDRMARTMEL